MSLNYLDYLVTDDQVVIPFSHIESIHLTDDRVTEDATIAKLRDDCQLFIRSLSGKDYVVSMSKLQTAILNLPQEKTAEVYARMKVQIVERWLRIICKGFT